MPEDIVLNLGEYGEILIEVDEVLTKGELRPIARGEERTRRKVDAGALLRAPLTGLGRLFMATLPQTSPNDPYDLDEFSVEFEIGIEAEVGSSVVAKITPSGAFTCTYTWKRKKTGAETPPLK